eukprot:SAG31_NODE_1042_length_10187_cov_54.452121_3_plen_242_part_00
MTTIGLRSDRVRPRRPGLVQIDPARRQRLLPHRLGLMHHRRPGPRGAGSVPTGRALWRSARRSRSATKVAVRLTAPCRRDALASPASAQPGPIMSRRNVREVRAQEYVQFADEVASNQQQRKQKASARQSKKALQQHQTAAQMQTSTSAIPDETGLAAVEDTVRSSLSKPTSLSTSAARPTVTPKTAAVDALLQAAECHINPFAPYPSVKDAFLDESLSAKGGAIDNSCSMLSQVQALLHL